MPSTQELVPTPRGSGIVELLPPTPPAAGHGGADGRGTPRINYPLKIDPVESQTSTHGRMKTHMLADGLAP